MEFKRFALAMVGHFLASLLYVLRRLRLIEAVVDTSSILEHREEIRELWEKRMMADDNQSSPSSTVAEKTSPKPQSEEGSEEAVAKTNSESETKVDHKMANGFAKPVNSNGIEDGNANHITEEKAEVPETAAQANDQKVDTDHDNNNCIDSLEEDNADDYVEEKTYTSELETSIIMKKAEDVPSKEEAHTTTVDEPVSEEKNEKEAVVAEPVSTAATSDTISTEEVDSSTKVEEPIASTAPAVEEQVSSTEKVATENETVPETSEKVEVHEETVTSASTTEVVQHVEEVTEVRTSETQSKTMEVEKSVEGDDDGFVCVEECLPKVEGNETEQDSVVMVEEQKNSEVSKDSEALVTASDEHKTATINGHEENPEAGPPTSTPEPGADDKPNNPEIEQFVKSGGVKRILPGVQKTEQPYSTCTTETKIAMEIREMREREEELRLMREQNLLSPVASPVPPKSPSTRSPSPSMKEGSSPTSPGCGYRVSSVFGHKGSTSPSPPVIPDEDKKFKGFSKESSVEKEIRLARDREEELRKQKGLPPREDDSYVKPSQVKSSQVRVFGKMAGANSSSIKQAATAKIQMEIEEQTQREMALRESGSIQTISQERTDAKVAKLKTPECTTPPATNGTSHSVANGNGNHTNGRSSPDAIPYKRVSPSPTNNRPATIFSQPNGKANISMHKFIASKGKETTFAVPRNGAPKEESTNRAAVPPPLVKLKRNVSVESKIQQEIMEMKQREEELKLLHMNRSNNNSPMDDEGHENEVNQKSNLLEYENGNGNGIHEEDLSPRHNKLIAQWEQRIQKAES